MFAGCFPYGAASFKVDFIVDGELYETVMTDKGTIKMPDDPTKAGHDFDGWFWDKDVWNKPFTLNSILEAPLSQSFKVYAKFISAEQNETDSHITYEVATADNSMSGRENHELLTIVRSTKELAKAASTRYYQYWTGTGGPNNAYYLAELTSKYDDDYFAKNSLILYLFGASNAGGKIEITDLQKQGDKLTIHTDFHMGMACAISYWTVAIEVPKADVANISKIEVKNECICPVPPIKMLYIILTPEATVAAYQANKTYTPEDFPEYSFSRVENLFTMLPNNPDFKRILYAYLTEPIEQNDQGLLNAIELLNQRADIYIAGP